MSEVRVRFAPSPTGALHLGGARTALFNYLFARHMGGKFLLRVEDTDKARSTDESKNSIIDAMEWMGMHADEDIVYQSQREPAHLEALQKLIDEDKVYKCYCTPEQRAQMREEALKAKTTFIYDGRCDGKPNQKEAAFVWRFRMPKEGETVVDDLVQGRVVTPNSELEDMVIARGDGSPLYNFVVAIDDAFMNVTHVIRGKDHLTNTPKQIHIYNALGLTVPKFAHLPLILGLSKRLRSAGIGSYKEQGYLASAVNNYIARLGWSHKDQELFSNEELISLFKLEDVNRSEGALNLDKMEWINQQHIQNAKSDVLAPLLVEFLGKIDIEISIDHPRLLPAIETVRARAKTMIEMADAARFYFIDDEEIVFDEKAKNKFLKEEACLLLVAMAQKLELTQNWDHDGLAKVIDTFCVEKEIKLKQVAQPARVAMVGEGKGPGLYETMEVLGKQSTINRLRRVGKN